MTIIKIKIDNFEDAKAFNRIATNQPFNIDVYSGRYIIDAKSIMGLLSLDLKKELELHIYEDESKCETFIAEINNIIVK